MSGHPSAERLSAFLDGELADAESRLVEEHLAACDACAAHVAELAAVDEAARSLPLEAPEAYFDDFAARVRARVTARPRRRVLVPAWGWAAAAAVLLAVVTPLALRERAAQSPAAVTARDADAPAAPPAAAPAAEAVPGRASGEERKRVDGRPKPEVGNLATQASQLEAKDRLLQREDADAGAAAAQDKREGAPELRMNEARPAEPPREEKQDRPKVTGQIAPAPSAAGQRQHGPRAQQYAPPPPAAPAVQEQVVDETSAAASADTLQDGVLAKERVAQRARRKSAEEPTGFAAAGGAGRDEEAARKLGAAKALKPAPGPARTGEEARARREAFRTLALERADDASADEARVGVVEQGVRAYRLDRRAEDRATAERDGRAYLARPDARQKPRVRALLAELVEIR